MKTLLNKILNWWKGPLKEEKQKSTLKYDVKSYYQSFGKPVEKVDLTIDELQQMSEEEYRCLPINTVKLSSVDFAKDI